MFIPSNMWSTPPNLRDLPRLETEVALLRARRWAFFGTTTHLDFVENSLGFSQVMAVFHHILMRKLMIYEWMEFGTLLSDNFISI